MAPEQLDGRNVDARSDVFAFGEVVYEMVTGRKAFESTSQASLIGAILHTVPPQLSAVQPTAPPPLDRLVAKCLAKDPDRRWQTASDLVDELRWLSEAPAAGPAGTAVAPGQTARSGPWILAGVAVVAVVAMLTALAVWTRPDSALRPGVVSRTQIGVQPAEKLADVIFPNSPISLLTRTGMTLSPDGQVLVFAGQLGDEVQLFRRDLNAFDAIAIPGTEGASGPFFSPDGDWIGFHALGGLHKVPISGGPPVLVTQTPPPFGASWGDNDLIVLGQGVSGLRRVSAEGGVVEPLTELDADRGELSHRLPYLLPGGEAVLFTVRTLLFGRWERARIEVQSLGTDERTVLIENGADARYVPTGHIVFTRLGTLMAVPFDVETLAVTGGPRSLLEGVAQTANVTNSGWDTGAAHVSVSETGTLAYLSGGIVPDHQRTLRQVDRSGRVETLPIDPGPFHRPRFSPDGQRVVVDHLGMAPDLWVHDLARGGQTRLGTDGYNGVPLWTPDGARVTFTASTGGPTDIFWQVADGSRPPERLTTTTTKDVLFVEPGSWSPDGRVLTFVQGNPGTGRDIWTLTVGEAGGPQPLIDTPAHEAYPEFSPDGDWLAFVSTESGQSDVYVKRYPPTEERFRVSTEGGGEAPAWSPDGTQLFYLSPCADQSCFPYQQLMVADVAASPRFTASIPRPVAGVHLFTGTDRSWDISPDGQQFLTVQNSPLAGC